MLGSVPRRRSQRIARNISAFNTEYNSIQLTFQNGSSPVTDNGGDGRIRGVEAELNLAPARNWTLDASVGYIDAEYQAILSGVPLTGNEKGEIAADLPEDDPYRKAMHPEDIAGKLRDMAEEIGELRASLRREKQTGSLIGQSPAFLKSVNLLTRAADSTITVLLTGETGVGKEVSAHWLHDNGPRRDKPFVAINCGAIPHDLIESELFGAEAGAYTGAQRQRLGRFERADGGTLFLDEVGDLPLAAQVKLLRVLQTGEVERLGGDKVRHVDVRIVAATNVDLTAAVDAKRFRADLFYRLNPFQVAIPPLRDRVADIPLFVEALVERLARRHGKPVRGVSDQAMRALIAYRWPGNVRELENVLERGVLLAEPGRRIDVDTLSIVLERTCA